MSNSVGTHHVIGRFETLAARDDAAGRLANAGFDRAAISDVSAGAATADGATAPAAVTSDTDRRQLRTLGTGMAAAAGGMAAAGLTIATGGAAGVGIAAAIAGGGAAAAATTAFGHSVASGAPSPDSQGGPGILHLAVLVPDDIRRQAAEAAMRAAGATDVHAVADPVVPSL